MALEAVYPWCEAERKAADHNGLSQKAEAALPAVETTAARSAHLPFMLHIETRITRERYRAKTGCP